MQHYLRAILLRPMSAGLLLGLTVFSSAAFCIAPSAARADLPANKPAAFDQVSSPSCLESIKSCFGGSKTERGGCLRESAGSEACAGLAIGKLTVERAAFEEMADVPGFEEAPAFLGPTTIDRACLENFDTQLLASVVNGEITRSTFKMLQRKLTSCSKEVTSDAPARS